MYVIEQTAALRFLRIEPQSEGGSMTPIELIHALERKKAALYGDVQVLDDVIICLKRTRHETIADLETKMELEFGHGWKALKEYLSGDVESKQKRANGA